MPGSGSAPENGRASSGSVATRSGHRRRRYSANTEGHVWGRAPPSVGGGDDDLGFDPVASWNGWGPVPRPRINLVLYYGVLAPCVAGREAVAPRVGVV